MAMDYILRCAPFGTTIRFGQVALRDQPAAVLHQRIPMKHSNASVPGPEDASPGDGGPGDPPAPDTDAENQPAEKKRG